MLAADTLTSAGDITVYNRSKIQIVKQKAICTTGMESDGDRFLHWLNLQERESFVTDSIFAAIVLSRTDTVLYAGDDPGEAIKPGGVYTKWTLGAGAATSYSDALLREVKYNAHKACELAAQYDRNCGLPVFSITKKQLELIHQDFNGYWVGTYKTPLNKIEDFLITHKQWLRT